MANPSATTTRVVESPNEMRDFILNAYCNDVKLAESLWKLYHNITKQPVEQTVQSAMVEHKSKMLRTGLDSITLDTPCDVNGSISEWMKSKHVYDYHLLGDAILILLCYLKLPLEMQVCSSYTDVFLKYTPHVYDGNMQWGDYFKRLYSNDKTLVTSINWNETDAIETCIVWVQLRMHLPNMPSHKPLVNFEILRNHKRKHTAYIFIVNLENFKSIGIYYKNKYIPAHSIDNLYNAYLKIYGVGLE